MSARSVHGLPVAVVDHRLSGGEQGLLSLLGLGPLGVRQTVHSLGGCRADGAEQRVVLRLDTGSGKKGRIQTCVSRDSPIMHSKRY